MMRAQLAEVRRRGEPVGALFAAEPGIYGRFGYGPAGRLLHLTLGRGVALRDVDGGDDLYLTFEHADVDRHAELLARCDDEARRDRPGWVSRPTRAQRRYLLEDPPALRRDAETLRVLLARAGGPDGELRGYALFRRAMKWEAAGPDGTVRVRALVALDAAARRALWARITDLDLMARVESPPLPPDDPLLHLVDLRATDAHVTDGLWVRLVDVPAALAARRYTSPVDAVLEVRDAFLPENAGRWHLRGGPDGATCDATDAPADVTLDVRDLGSAYLGGESIAAMAAAGLVTELRPGAVAELAAAFGWHVAPWSGFFF
jgi:predicted acetyltransferase